MNIRWAIHRDIIQDAGGLPPASPTPNTDQVTEYYPFGMSISKNFTTLPVNNYKYNSKEEQEMPGRWLDYGARFYDAQLGRWHSVDPLAENYRRWTPYNYCVNNPMRFVDPDGMEMTDFKDKNGNLIQHIEDGSNAVFQLTGDSRSDEYFKFTGYDVKQGGKNEVNVESAIKGAQDYTRENYTSDINDKGVCTQTYCNYGTMNIAKTYESAVEVTGKTADISDVKGSAITIGENLSTSEVVKHATDLSAAQKSAKEGSLVIGYWSGHVFTLNKQGMVNNVGAPRAKNNVFDPKHTESKGQKFYIIQVK
jgi:RHS repeat-associated protein